MKTNAKLTLTFLFVLVSAFLVSPLSHATVLYEERTLEEIREKYRERPFPFIQFKEVEYEIEPSSSFPYNAGKVKKEYLQEALDCVNFIRYLAGLPDDISLDESYIQYTQHGAVLLAAIDQLTHSPYQPADMPDDYFETAYKGPSRSNCGWGHYNILNSIQSYMDDSDASNIDRVGHRRWLLNTSMQKIGFGYYKKYTDTYVFDFSREEAIEFDYICWPAKNYMPLEFMNTGLAWSVNLGNAYDIPILDNVRVTLVRRSDGKSWEFSKNDHFEGAENYFNIDNSGYGLGKCIIFRPDIEKYLENDVFDVQITGIFKNNAAEKINYSVQMFTLQEPASVKTSIKEGTYLNEAEVAFSCESPDAYIYYSTDDLPSGTYYDAPIRIHKTTTFKAYSVIEDKKSEVSTFHYKIEPASQWAVKYIEQAVTLNIVPIAIQTQYLENISRADFCKLAVSFLVKKSGKTIQELMIEKNIQPGQNVFSDTTDNEILVANALGIVNGVGNGRFNPDGMISRQEAAVMLMRTASVLGITTPEATAVSFADSDDFAEWAKAGIAFVSSMVDKNSNQKVMSGVGNNLFSPLGTYTREQSIVTMLRLFYAMD